MMIAKNEQYFTKKHTHIYSMFKFQVQRFFFLQLAYILAERKKEKEKKKQNKTTEKKSLTQFGMSLNGDE